MAHAPVNPWLLAGGMLSLFIHWSSAIVLVYGLVHAIGLWRGWAHLKGVS